MAGDRNTETHVDAPLLELLGHDVDDIYVTARQHLRHRLEDGHLHAEVGHCGRELAPDGAGTDDDGRLRHHREIEELVAREHHTPVGLEAGDGPGHGPGGQDDVRSGELGAVADLHEVALGEHAGALHDRDLLLLQQAREALPEVVDHRLLAGLADREVDRRLARLDAELRRLGDRAERVRRLQELLGRDAAPVEAGAANLVLLDHRSGEAGRAGVERRSVATRPTADDHEIEVLGRWNHPLVVLLVVLSSANCRFVACRCAGTR